MVAETPSYGFVFAGAEEAIVHKDARKLPADRPREEGRHHRRIDTSRKPADDPEFSHAFAQRFDLLFDERRHLPVAAATADIADEISQKPPAVLCVRDFRVKLQPVNGA